MDSETLRKQKFIINTIYIAIGLAIYYVFFRYVIYKVWPFMIAAVVALCLNGLTKKLAAKLPVPRKLISGVLVFLVIAVLGTGITLLIIRLVMFTLRSFGNLPAWYTANIAPSIQWVMDKYEEFMVGIDPETAGYISSAETTLLTKSMEIVTKISTKAVGTASSFVTHIPAKLLSLLICVVATFITAIDSDNIGRFIMKQFNVNTQEAILEAKQSVRKGIRQIIISYGMIMFMTFCELMIGFVIFKIPNPWTKAGVIALFDILPIVGSGTILIPWAIILLIKGSYVTALEIFGMYIVIAIVRNSIEPHVVGDSIGIHPVLMLASIFLGATILGPLGIIIMPFTMIVIKNLNEAGRIHLFK